MSDEQDKLKLSLEAPKLFGRKKKATTPADASEAASTSPAPKKSAPPEPVEEPVEEPTALVPAAEPEPVVEPEPITEAEPTTEPEPLAEPEPIAETEPIAEAPADDEPTDVIVVADPVTEEPDEPTVVLATEPEPEPDPAEAADPEPVADETTKTRTPAKKVAEKAAKIPGLAKPKTPARPARATAAEPEDPELIDSELIDPELIDPELEDAEIAAMAAQGPLLSVYRSAALTGLVVGAAMVVLTWLSLRGCEAVRGTSSCGGGPGFLLLIATFAVCVLLGSALLRAFDIPDPGSSSFLAVGLVAVVALLFLIDLLDSWSMLIIIPILSIGAYLASVWVTKTFVEPVET